MQSLWTRKFNHRHNNIYIIWDIHQEEGIGCIGIKSRPCTKMISLRKENNLLKKQLNISSKIKEKSITITQTFDWEGAKKY